MTAPRAAPPARLLAALLAASVLTGTAGGALQLGVPLLALSLGAGNAQVGLVRSVSGMGMLLLVVPVGFLVDRLGPRRVYRIGALAGAGIAAAYAASPALPLVVALMAVEGLCAPLRFTSLTTAFYARLASIGIEKAGWFKGTLSFGLTLLGPLLGGLLARGAGFPVLFATVAALHLLAAASGALLEAGNADAHAPVARPSRHPAQGAELLRLLRLPGIGPVLAAELLGAATFAAFSAFVVVVSLRVHGADAAVASRILIVEGLAFILTAFAGGRLAERRRALRATAGLAGAAATLGTALAGAPILLALAGIGIGVATGLIHVHVSSWIAGLASASGRLSSLFQVAAGLGVTLGPLAAAAAGRRLPAQAVLLVFAPPFLLLAWSAWSRPAPSPAAASGDVAPAEASPTT